MLTYHPALNMVYDILRDSSNVLLVDQKHKELFQNKVFLSFRRAKNLNPIVVGLFDSTILVGGGKKAPPT